MSTTTRAAVVESGGAPFTLTAVELAEPGPHEVLVRVVATGLCHTDLGAASGGLPFPLPGVLGHEGAGVVEEVGSAVTGVVPGDHVVLSFTSCGDCRNCRGGHPAYCATWLPLNLIGGRRADGSSTISRDGEPLGGHFFGQSSFAERALVDERSLVKVDPDVPLESIAPLGCGVQTGVGAVWNVLKPRLGDTIVVLGAGAVGLSAVMAAALTPATRIIAVDRVAERLSLAEELGATHTVNAGAADLGETLAVLTDGREPTASSRRPATSESSARAPTRSPPGAPWSSWGHRRSAVKSPWTSTGCSPGSGSWVSPSATARRSVSSPRSSNWSRRGGCRCTA